MDQWSNSAHGSSIFYGIGFLLLRITSAFPGPRAAGPDSGIPHYLETISSFLSSEQLHFCLPAAHIWNALPRGAGNLREDGGLCVFPSVVPLPPYRETGVGGENPSLRFSSQLLVSRPLGLFTRSSNLPSACLISGSHNLSATGLLGGSFLRKEGREDFPYPFLLLSVLYLYCPSVPTSHATGVPMHIDQNTAPPPPRKEKVFLYM